MIEAIILIVLLAIVFLFMIGRLAMILFADYLYEEKYNIKK